MVLRKNGGNNQAVLFVLTSATYQRQSCANVDLLPEEPCLHRWNWPLNCFAFVPNKDQKSPQKKRLICFQEQQCENAITLKAQ